MAWQASLTAPVTLWQGYNLVDLNHKSDSSQLSIRSWHASIIYTHVLLKNTGLKDPPTHQAPDYQLISYESLDLT